MRRHREVTNRALLLLLVAAVLGRVLTLGVYPLMDTTEARYAEIARKMVELNDWVTPWFDYGVPFWAKPPLSIWLTSASFKLFGINEIAARLPHWLAGMGVAWLVWDLSARRSRREALYASALLIGSMLFFVAAGAVMTDMTLVLSTTLAMRGFWLGLYGNDAERKRERWLLFVAAGVGLLAKGPIALVLIALPVAGWAVTTRNVATAWRELPWLRGGVLALAIAAPWYVLAEWRTPGFLDYFLVGEHWHRFVTPGWSGDLYGSAHSHPRGTIWLLAFVDLLPWTILLPVAALVWRKTGGIPAAIPADRSWRVYLLFWGLAPIVFFTAASNVLWPYVLPGIPAFALWASDWLARHPRSRKCGAPLDRWRGFHFASVAGLSFWRCRCPAWTKSSRPRPWSPITISIERGAKRSSFSASVRFPVPSTVMGRRKRRSTPNSSQGDLRKARVSLQSRLPRSAACRKG